MISILKYWWKPTPTPANIQSQTCTQYTLFPLNAHCMNADWRSVYFCWVICCVCPIRSSGTVIILYRASERHAIHGTLYLFLPNMDYVFSSFFCCGYSFIFLVRILYEIWPPVTCSYIYVSFSCGQFILKFNSLLVNYGQIEQYFFINRRYAHKFHSGKWRFIAFHSIKLLTFFFKQKYANFSPRTLWRLELSVSGSDNSYPVKINDCVFDCSCMQIQADINRNWLQTDYKDWMSIYRYLHDRIRHSCIYMTTP